MLIGPLYYVIYASQDTVLSTRAKIRCYLREPRYGVIYASQDTILEICRNE